jgi:hypothetical protein
MLVRRFHYGLLLVCVLLVGVPTAGPAHNPTLISKRSTNG